MKKVYWILSLVVLVFLAFVFVRRESPRADYINVYSWGEFISDGSEGGMDVNKEFTRRTGIKVNYKTFQNNEELFAKLSGGMADYDVVIPSDYMVSKLIENNMLEKLDFSNIPNFKFISEDFKSLDFDPKNEYSVPYVWGMVGILYDKNEVKVEEENITWDTLWNPKYRGKILMFDNARDSFAVSLLRLGYSINDKDPEHWKQAAQELLIQKPLVQAYVMDQIFNKMQNQEAFLAPYYAGDAATVMKNNPGVGFVIPKTGSIRFIDSLCIPKNCLHKKYAEEYINFMCETSVALANVKHTGYSTPHVKAYDELDDSIKNNKIFYPDSATLKKSQIFTNLPKELNSLIDKLWIEVKAGGTTDNPWILPSILIGLLVIYTIVFFVRKRKVLK